MSPLPPAASPGAAGPLGAPRALKGRQTRAAILDAALVLAAREGLEGLSMGALAELMQMSKSGVFAHFGSREELQLSVIREYHARFAAEVFTPAMACARGMPRLHKLFERWVLRVSDEIDSGCLYISGAVEFDDRPGPVRDALAAMVQAWQQALHRAIGLAIQEGHLHAGTDARQVLFEVHGLVLALHHDARFLRHAGVLERARAAFERVVRDSATPAGLALLPSLKAPARVKPKTPGPPRAPAARKARS
jgi:AcrR family transcriptional regulator